MRGIVLLALLGLFALMASAASATDLMVNGGFEDPVLADGEMATGPGIIGGWMLNTGTVAIINPTGDGSVSEGLVVEEGSNYMRMLDDPYGDERATAAWFWVENVTIQANHRYTYRFRYGKSSDPNKTWTEAAVWMAACTAPGVWEGNLPFGNTYLVSWSGDPGWKTWEYSETVPPGDPRIGMYLGVTLEGHTFNTTDAYYFDKVEIIDTPILPTSITYQGELTNAQGTPIADAPHDFVFKFYGEATGGQPNWTSSTMSITPTSGLFTAQIDNIVTETAFPNGNVWMEVVVGGETLSPRIKVSLELFALVGGGIK